MSDPQIEVTPAMIEAGIKVLRRLLVPGGFPAGTIAEMFVEMERARRGENSPPTDRDRETEELFWNGTRPGIAAALATAREEGRLAEREKWIALAGPYWRTGREISPLAFLAATRREAIEECAKIADAGRRGDWMRWPEPERMAGWKP